MKTKMNHVYYNSQTNVMGLKELNEKGIMIKSNIRLGNDPKEDGNDSDEPNDEGIS